LRLGAPFKLLDPCYFPGYGPWKIMPFRSFLNVNSLEDVGISFFPPSLLRRLIGNCFPLLILSSSTDPQAPPGKIFFQIRLAQSRGGGGGRRPPFPLAFPFHVCCETRPDSVCFPSATPLCLVTHWLPRWSLFPLPLFFPNGYLGPVTQISFFFPFPLFCLLTLLSFFFFFLPLLHVSPPEMGSRGHHFCPPLGPNGGGGINVAPDQPSFFFFFPNCSLAFPRQDDFAGASFSPFLPSPLFFHWWRVQSLLLCFAQSFRACDCSSED